MPIIELPDGSQKIFEEPVTVLEVAATISPRLAEVALAGLINDSLVDTSYQITKDAKVKIITERDPEGLETLRHSAAHLLAQAVKHLYPTAQITIGPVIEDGFYYDFAFSRAFTPEDLIAIETEMKELASADLPVHRYEWSRDEAIQYFHQMGEEYKVRIINEIPDGELLSVYQQGDFLDLCRGPHVPRTGLLSAFKLTKVAGAYWRGNAKNEMLQRIYGTAWPDQKSLQAYLKRLEEAQKRDHRKLGKQLDFFHLQEEAPGMIFWHARGLTLSHIIQQYIRNIYKATGFKEVLTPQIVDRSLWERSGHWQMYSKEMFVTETEDHTYAIKPMNCPCHIQIFNQDLRSYRDLPYRLAEFGVCHRSEPSGALHGLMRVRSFVQDDGHIFCREDQIQDEVGRFIATVLETYKDFGFDEIILKLATRPNERIGSELVWSKAEQALAAALDASGTPWRESPGEGAFYGPKIEFSLKDCLGRVWQCGTMQVDFSMPSRLDAVYVAEDGSKQVPVMLHRAILGSVERFIAILIEHYAGALPLWLSPVQAVVATITDKHQEYAQEMVENLKNQGFRVETDLRNEKIGFKIREHTLNRIPYILVVGDKEVEEQRVAVRTLSGENLGSKSLAEVAQEWHKQCQAFK